MVSRSLIHLTSEIAALERALLENGGELPADLEAHFDLASGDLREKVDRYRHIIDAFGARADYFAELEKQARDAKKVFENQAERLKANLRRAIEATGQDELLGNDWRYKLTRGKEKLVTTNDLPDTFKKEKVTLEPDKDQIISALEMGFEVPGAALVETTSLRCYVNVAGRAREVKEISDEPR